MGLIKACQLSDHQIQIHAALKIKQKSFKKNELQRSVNTTSMLARIVHCTTWAMTCTLSNESWQMHNSTKLVTVLSWAWLSFLFHGWKFPFSKMLGTDQEPSCCLKHQQETTVNIDQCMHDTKLVFFSIVNTWKKSFYWHHVDGYFQILPCRKKLLKINHQHWTTFTDICLHWLCSCRVRSTFHLKLFKLISIWLHANRRGIGLEWATK